MAYLIGLMRQSYFFKRAIIFIYILELSMVYIIGLICDLTMARARGSLGVFPALTWLHCLTLTS